MPVGQRDTSKTRTAVSRRQTRIADRRSLPEVAPRQKDREIVAVDDALTVPAAMDLRKVKVIEL
jgi:hypothetical protein